MNSAELDGCSALPPSRPKINIFAYCNKCLILLQLVQIGGYVMERQTQTLLLSREERAALDAAILDICAFNAEPGRAKTPVSAGFLSTPLTLTALFGFVLLAWMVPAAHALIL